MTKLVPVAPLSLTKTLGNVKNIKEVWETITCTLQCTLL